MSDILLIHPFNIKTFNIFFFKWTNTCFGPNLLKNFFFFFAKHDSFDIILKKDWFKIVFVKDDFLFFDFFCL